MPAVWLGLNWGLQTMNFTEDISQRPEYKWTMQTIRRLELYLLQTLWAGWLTCWWGLGRLLLLLGTARTGLSQLAGQVEGERGRQEGEGGEGGVGEVFALLGACRRVHVVVCRVELHQVPLSWVVLEEWHSEMEINVIMYPHILQTSHLTTRYTSHLKPYMIHLTPYMIHVTPSPASVGWTGCQGGGKYLSLCPVKISHWLTG